jgi:hypothetical protein
VSGRAVRAVIWLPGLAVALGAAVATAHGLFEVAVAARVPAGIAWLYPLITDGLALVAYAATARLTGGPARYAWSVVVLAAGLSGLAQAVYLSSGAAVEATPALRFGVGAWPAVAAAVVAHLLYLLADADPARADTHPTFGTQRDDHKQPPVAGAPATAAVQTDVQPSLYSTAAVQLTPYNPAAGTPSGTEPGASAPDPHTAESGPVEQPDARDEQPNAEVYEAPPRDRARSAAVQHAARHGALPTVSELEALAAVSRGTAAAALKALRQHPTPLHLVHNTPDPRTQP